MRNIRWIKHLAIDGGINDYDLDIIRLYTADATHPVMLDFSLTKLNSEVKNPCAYEGYVPLQKECDVTIAVDNCIPDRMFDGAKGLAGCMMSDRFLSIGARAFASTPMTQIDIPGTIISIGDYASTAAAILPASTLRSSGCSKRWEHRPSRQAVALNRSSCRGISTASQTRLFMISMSQTYMSTNTSPQHGSLTQLPKSTPFISPMIPVKI